jgi:S-adenosylmethionine hydrolase
LSQQKRQITKNKKKVRNRLAWIDKRFKTIENEIEKERALTINPDYNDNYEILEDALNNMNTLEKEYLELMEEQEMLLK